MGSVRSSSTAYSSSNNIIKQRNRHNSVYSNPDANDPTALPGQQLRPTMNTKMKLYDRFPRNKSGRNLKNIGKRGESILCDTIIEI